LTILNTIVQSKRLQFPSSRTIANTTGSFIHGSKSSNRTSRNGNPFVQALRQNGISIIGEVKPKSPSAGHLLENSRLNDILDLYKNHCTAISVLTDEEFFGGSFKLLKQVKRTTNLPALCKDFIVSTEQISIAKAHGADAVLLIAKILDADELKTLLFAALDAELCPVVEVNSLSDVAAIADLPVDVVLINNRNLDTMKIDLETTSRLACLLQDDQIVISASGIKSNDDIQSLLPAARRFLIGTSLMQSSDPASLLSRLTGRAERESNAKSNVDSKVGLDLGSDIGLDIGSNIGLDAGSNAGSNAGSDSDSNAGSDADSNAGSDADSNAGSNANSNAAPHSHAVADSALPKVKICGITNIDDAKMALDAGAEFLGLIFAPSSRRKVSVENARLIIAAVDKRAKIVGVFQNQKLNEVNFLAEELNLDLIQLHGDEDAAYAGACVRPVIKAFDYSAENVLNTQQLLKFPTASYFLFDLNKKSIASENQKSYERFTVLANTLGPIRHQIPPFFLAGQLSEHNVQQAFQTVLPFAIDVASGVEKSPGKKSTTLTKRFCNLAKSKTNTHAPQVVN